MDRLTEQLYIWANGDQELVNQWTAVIRDEPFVSLADELEEAGYIPELDVAGWTSTSSTTLPDGSEISDTFSSFSDVANQAELNEGELPSIIEGLYGESMEVTQAGAQEMFSAASMETSIEAMDTSIAALDGEIEALVAEVTAIEAEIAELEGAVAVAETAVAEAATVEAAAAAEVAGAVAAEGAAVAAEAADWWTIIGGIITAGAIAAAGAAVIIANQKHDEAQQKKKEAEDKLKKNEDDLDDKRHLFTSLPLKCERKKKRKESLQQKKNEKQDELQRTKNKVEAYKMIHKTINLKLWFIKYWLAIKKKSLSRPLNVPIKQQVKPEMKTVQEGDGHRTIKVIKASEESERTFKNKEFLAHYGAHHKIAVVWEHVNETSNKLKSLETVKIWASNNGVSTERQSQCGMWGVIGDSAYTIALEAVERNPKLFVFYENGSHTSGKQFQLDKYDSVFLGIRSAPWPAWQAACQGFEVQYTCS